MTGAQMTRINALIADVSHFGNHVPKEIKERAINVLEGVYEMQDGIGAYHIIRNWKELPFNQFIMLLSEGLDKVINN